MVHFNTSQLCKISLDDVSSTGMINHAFILSELFPLMVLDVILCPLCNLNTF